MTSSLLTLREEIFCKIYFYGIYFCDLGPQNQRNPRNLILRFDCFRKALRKLFLWLTATRQNFREFDFALDVYISFVLSLNYKTSLFSPLYILIFNIYGINIANKYILLLWLNHFRKISQKLFLWLVSIRKNLWNLILQFWDKIVKINNAKIRS